MGNYSKDRLHLMAQSLMGERSIWFYDDTGTMASVAEQAGFIANAREMGLARGDLVFVRALSGTSALVSGLGVIAIQDTGTTSGTLGAATSVGDTS